MPYITIHRLIAPMIAAGNKEWREMMRRERADPVAQFKANGGTVDRQPYRGDVLVSEFDDFRAFVEHSQPRRRS